MMPKAKVALSAAVMIGTVFAAAAADDKFPSLDLQKNCTSRAKSSEALMGDKTVAAGLLTQCLKSEKEAQAALAAAWKDIPPNYRTLCIRPGDFSPSYVEWISCLEMNMDVKKLRSKN